MDVGSKVRRCVGSSHMRMPKRIEQVGRGVPIPMLGLPWRAPLLHQLCLLKRNLDASSWLKILQPSCDDYCIAARPLGSSWGNQMLDVLTMRKFGKVGRFLNSASC